MKTRLASAWFIAAVIGSSALTPLLASYDRHDRHAKAINQPEPLYPFELQKAETEGAVLVSFTITAQGNVSDPVVVKSTDRVFEQPTLQAMKHWKFSPAIIAGRPAAVPALQLITYKVPGKELGNSTFMLIGRLKNRLSKPDSALESYTSTSLCFCGSGKEFNDCHFLSLQASN